MSYMTILPPRVLIICAGDGTRWGDYLGAPKHFAPINGEPILHRTVRLVREVSPMSPVFVITPRGDTEEDTREALVRYAVTGAQTRTAELTPELRDADKFASSRHLWAKVGRTVVIYGDTYLTHAAVRAVMNPLPLLDGWGMVARWGASAITGTPWGENLALVLDPVAHDLVWDAITRVPSMTSGWMGGRCGGSEIYMLLETGDPCQYSRQGPHGIHVDDWSDDFDYPADYDRWCERYALASEELRRRAQ